MSQEERPVLTPSALPDEPTCLDQRQDRKSPASFILETTPALRPRLLLTLLCLALWLPGFFTLPPTDRDESRFAQATKQMNETGDYVRIMNGAVPRLRKPIGIYWLQAPFAAAAGAGLANPIWPYRVPSLLGGIAAVLATFQAGLWLAAGRSQAVLAAGMLASCVLLTTEAHIAKTDAALLGATTIVMTLLARAWLGATLRRWQAALFWLALAAGILLKGPITPMVAGLAAATLCVWERRARWLLALRPVWGGLLLLASTIPWFVAITVATKGAFFAQAVGGDLAGKLAGGAEAHGGLPGLHLLLLPLLAFPSTLPVLAALPAAWSDRQDAKTRFLIAWALPAWLVFEAVPTKLPHYTLPLYPALFLLAARFLPCAVPAWPRRIGQAALATVTALLAAVALALPLWLGAPWWLGVPAACCAILAGWLAWRRRIAWSVLACIPLYASILQLELPRARALWIGPPTLALLKRTWPGWNARGDGLAVAGYAEPSLVFLTGTHTQLLPNGTSAAAALKSGSARLVLVAGSELGRFAAAGLPAHRLGEVTGFNYSRGRWISLTAFAR